jgi:hypothetical protein
VLTVTADPVFTVTANVLPFPLVKVKIFDNTEAVTNAFGVNDAVFANEAVFGTNVDKLTLKLLPSPLIKFKLGLLNDAVYKALGSPTEPEK